MNQGPGSFSGVRIALAVAKGLEISNKVKLCGNLTWLRSEHSFDQYHHEEIENKLLSFKISKSFVDSNK